MMIEPKSEAKLSFDFSGLPLSQLSCELCKARADAMLMELLQGNPKPVDEYKATQKTRNFGYMNYSGKSGTPQCPKHI